MKLNGKTKEESGRKWTRCEFAVGNRDAIVPPDLGGMAQRVLSYFATPNMTVEFSPGAKQLFLAFAACFSAKAGMLRDSGEDASAPRAATGAWHLAVLSAANMIFELAIGEAGSQKLACLKLLRQTDTIDFVKLV